MSEIRMVQRDEDYEMLASWWTGHGWPAVPKHILPPLGIIADNIAAGWLYMDNGGTGVCMMEWLVTDPKVSPIATVRALRVVVDFLKSEASRMDYGVMLTTCNQEGLARLLENKGFQRTDTGMIHLIGGLK